MSRNVHFDDYNYLTYICKLEDKTQASKHTLYEHDLKVEFHPPIDMNASKICTYIIPPFLQSFIILALHHIKKINSFKRCLVHICCIYNVMKF